MVRNLFCLCFYGYAQELLWVQKTLFLMMESMSFWGGGMLASKAMIVLVT